MLCSTTSQMMTLAFVNEAMTAPRLIMTLWIGLTFDSNERFEGDVDDDDDEWEDTDEEGDFDSEGGFSDDEDVEDGGRNREFLFMDEETKSRFTEYSLTSSVMRRNEQLTLLDDRFEKVKFYSVSLALSDSQPL